MIVGAVVSTTVITWLHVLLFPHASRALHVRVATYVFPHVALVTVVNIASVGVPHASLKLGASNVLDAVYS